MTILKKFPKTIALAAAYFLGGAILLWAITQYTLPASALALSWMIFCTTIPMLTSCKSRQWVLLFSAMFGIVLARDFNAPLESLGMFDFAVAMIILFIAAKTAAGHSERSVFVRWFIALIFLIIILVEMSAGRMISLILLALCVFMQEQAAGVIQNRLRSRARKASSGLQIAK